MADRAGTALSALPAPRNVLAELIRSIAAIPTDAAASGDVDNNPLRRLPPDQRSHLATLHVLFPATLLPALDLLDRRRVVRWGEQQRQRQQQQLGSALPSSSLRSSPSLYQIRGGGDRPHVVHLRAWHCTCAFFALRAAASTASTATAGEDVQKEAEDDAGVDSEEEKLLPPPLHDALPHLPLAFSTPPCKHLLACLLAEEWAALDGYVVAGEDDTAPGTDAGGCAPETLAGIVAGVL